MFSSFFVLAELFDDIYSKTSNCSRQKLNNLFPFLSNSCEIFLISSLAFYVLDPYIVSIVFLFFFKYKSVYQNSTQSLIRGNSKNAIIKNCLNELYQPDGTNKIRSRKQIKWYSESRKGCESVERPMIPSPLPSRWFLCRFSSFGQYPLINNPVAWNWSFFFFRRTRSHVSVTELARGHAWNPVFMKIWSENMHRSHSASRPYARLPVRTVPLCWGFN